jgi:hypothetical protein
VSSKPQLMTHSSKQFTWINDNCEGEVFPVHIMEVYEAAELKLHSSLTRH